MKERGLFIIKPDARLIGEAPRAAEKIVGRELTIADQREVQMTPRQVGELYHDKQDELSQYWIGYLTTMPSLALMVVGEECNRKLGEIKAEMREEFNHDAFYTGTHSSDSEEDCEREVKILGLDND